MRQTDRLMPGLRWGTSLRLSFLIAAVETIVAPATPHSASSVDKGHVCWAVHLLGLRPLLLLPQFEDPHYLSFQPLNSGIMMCLYM